MVGLSDITGFFDYLLVTFGYLGIFLISLIGAATIILPIPSQILVFAAGAVLNPWLVGLVAGAGAALGETTGYGVGFGGRQLIKRKYKKQMERAKKLTDKYNPFLIIVLFAVSPLPHDIIGILSGVARYDIRKFILATFIGKAILMTAIAWAGFLGINTIMGYVGII